MKSSHACTAFGFQVGFSGKKKTGKEAQDIWGGSHVVVEFAKGFETSRSTSMVSRGSRS